MDLQAEKKKLRKLRKKKRQAAKRLETIQRPVRWLSNLAEIDLPKIRRLFDPIVSLPKASGPYTVERQVADGIIGLYVEGEENEVCSSEEG